LLSRVVYEWQQASDTKVDEHIHMLQGGVVRGQVRDWGVAQFAKLMCGSPMSLTLL